MPKSANFPNLKLPDYDGGSIANIPATAASLLGIPFKGLPPLRHSLWSGLGEDVERVVLVIIDAMGSNIIARNAPILAPYLSAAAVRGQLTSVFPSTTAAALTSMWTGLSPAQHGLVGLRLLLPEIGTVGQMIHLTPAFGHMPGALVDAGLEPEPFLHGPGLAEQFAGQGVTTYAFKGREIVDSPLSKMHGRGVTANYGAYSFSEMMWQVRNLLEEKVGERLFASAYWPTIDTLSHRHTPLHPAVDAELAALFQQLFAHLVAPLSATARKGTVLLIAADHGHELTPPSLNVSLANHPELLDMLVIRPSGGARTAYLYARQGCAGDVLQYVNQYMGEAALALPSADVLANGWLGPEPFAPKTRFRVGDVMVLMQGGHLLMMPSEADFISRFVGMHGGMTAAEMEVPWLGYRLD